VIKKYIKQKIKNWFYKTFYGIKIGYDFSMFPKIGEGKYCTIKRKGNYIDIYYNVEPSNFIRLIPYTPNFGIFIEYYEYDRLKYRQILSFDDMKILLMKDMENG